MTHNRQLNGKEELDKLSLKLTKKELELSALLEITKSINANLPESSLYKIFHFTLLGNLNIPRLALFVLDLEWSCKVCYGCKSNMLNLPCADFMGRLDTVTLVSTLQLEAYSEFDLIVPIAHKNQVLAYVLIGGIDSTDDWKRTQLDFVKTVASIIIVAVENKKLARKQLQQEAIKKEMEIAREVQSMLFPKQLPNTHLLEINATYLPNFSIGGDYYDYIPLDAENFIICIADVSGKGISAALLMSNFQAALRTLARQTNDLTQIVKELNHSIISNAKGERFVTLFIALVNTRLQKINYINAGHNPPFLVSADGRQQLLEKGCTVLGAFTKIPCLEEESISYSPNTLLFCYTDGLTETNNNQFEEFGMDGIKKHLVTQQNQNLEKAHLSLAEDLHQFKEEQNYPDDITYMSCLLK